MSSEGRLPALFVRAVLFFLLLCDLHCGDDGAFEFSLVLISSLLWALGTPAERTGGKLWLKVPEGTGVPHLVPWLSRRCPEGLHLLSDRNGVGGEAPPTSDFVKRVPSVVGGRDRSLTCRQPSSQVRNGRGGQNQPQEWAALGPTLRSPGAGKNLVSSIENFIVFLLLSLETFLDSLVSYN